MTNINVYLLVLFLTLISCNETKTINDVYHIDFVNSNLGSADDLFNLNQVNMIQLETSDSILISDNYTLEYADKNIFIADFGVGQILRFNEFGKFLNKIGNQGHGPTEYNRPSDVIVDVENKLVEVLCEPNSTIKKYTYDGKYVSEQKFDFPSHSFVKDNKGAYLLHAYVCNHLVDDIMY